LDTLYWQTLRRGIKVYPEFQMIDLIVKGSQVVGLIVYELATGGFGKVYKITSNAFASTGEGVYLAYQAGIPLEDMEFVQFHPTGVYGLGILISEAARGEGGILRNGQGERFMEKYAPTIKDLAPRDLVSRAIYTEIQEGRGIQGRDFVHLDLTHLGKDRLAEKLSDISSFAKIYLGIDPSTAPIPVHPTCHYMMGGIPTNRDGQVLNQDQRVVPGLYAAGECACLSLHGANRLGCNSLLDLVVFGRLAGMKILQDLRQLSWSELPPQPGKRALEKLESLKRRTKGEKAHVLRSSLQQTMTDHCSVFRNHQSLTKGLEEIRALKERYARVMIDNQGEHFNTDLLEALELESLLGLSEAIIASALPRRESRGAHSREDYPERDLERETSGE
jgi:succinate dehydrogenase / fumarate reductase, flavoprotein subunit